MAYLHVSNIRLAGLAACVPKNIVENKSLGILLAGGADKLIASTGIERRRVAEDSVTTSDLCYQAALKLMQDMKWAKDEIDCLVLVTQFPDYILPATSCILQHRLGLREECYTLDISLGCSGWVYGLSVISSLLSGGQMRKGILLAGDISISCSPVDKSTYPLFGDAATATALVFDENSPGMKFHLATDGSGYKAIIIPDGGFRNPVSPESFTVQQVEPGIARNKLNLVLEGMDVFSFGINKAPETIHKLVSHFLLDYDEINYFVFHQANLFMNEKIRKKLHLPIAKVPYSLKDFGNTSSATIPLTMLTQLQPNLVNENLKILACGFGVGLSWGSVYFETDHIICSELIEV